jgi:hypothetical protein
MHLSTFKILTCLHLFEDKSNPIRNSHECDEFFSAYHLAGSEVKVFLDRCKGISDVIAALSPHRNA